MLSSEISEMAVQPSFKKLERYFGDLHAFGLQLSETALKFQQAVRAGRFPERGASFHYDRNDPGDPLNRSIDITRRFEFLIAATGAFSSGKSTLLNVLLNIPDLLPSSAIPLTAVCTVVRYGTTPRIQVRYVPFEEAFERIGAFIERPFRKEFTRADQLQEAIERPENFLDHPADRESLKRFARLLQSYDHIVNRSIPFEERYPFMAGGGSLGGGPETGNRVRYYVPTPAQEEEYLSAGGDPALWVTREWLALIRDVALWVESPLLRNNMVFLDLPGLNCREDYHRRAIREYCNLADCILLTAFQPGNQADEEIVQNFKALSSNYREKLFFVFNRVDHFQTEPVELDRSFDYLAKDCLDRDFPRDRFFLTSAFLARERMLGSDRFHDHFDSFSRAFQGYQSTLPGLSELIEHARAPEDPGGVGYFRQCLQSFLTESAYQTKISEILQNYDKVLDDLRASASPRFEDIQRIDEKELLARTVLDYFKTVRQQGRSAVYGFRYDYLRGHQQNGSASLGQDLKQVLERVHHEIQRRIVSYFNQPIQTAPPREDPVSDFDLRRIGDDASNQLRREFQEIITSAVVDCVRQRFYEYLNRGKFKEHVQDLFRGTPEWIGRFDEILERFEFMLRHSLICKIRSKFYSMPGGRDLKRLEQSASIADMKTLLVKVFTEFYPNWIFQNVYSEIQNGLWLSFFLDAEELEQELRRFFDSCQGVLTTPSLLDRVKIPREFSEGFGELYEVAGVCRQIEELMQQRDSLGTAHSNLETVTRV